MAREREGGLSVSVARIRKDDTVIAISGADAGKTGKVLQVLPARDKALVEGLRMVKKTLRKSQDNPQGGITEKEALFPQAKLMLYCPHDKKGVRVRVVADGERKIRKCRKCGHAFDG